MITSIEKEKRVEEETWKRKDWKSKHKKVKQTTKIEVE